MKYIITLFAITGPTNFTSYMATLASIMSDSVGDFCFVIDPSFSGKYITIYIPNSLLHKTTVGISSRATDSVNIGIVAIKK
jgi:hypothetical protein